MKQRELIVSTRGRIGQCCLVSPRSAIGIAALVVITTLPYTASAQEPSRRVGIEVSRFLKLIEEVEEPGAFPLSYRHESGGGAYRLGFSYRQSTGEDDGFIRVGTRGGYDRPFVRSGPWTFYAGADAIVLVESYESVGQTDVEVALSPVLGFEYRVLNRLSLSTEPRLLASYHARTADAFGERDIESRFEFGLAGIGQLAIGLHF